MFSQSLFEDGVALNLFRACSTAIFSRTHVSFHLPRQGYRDFTAASQWRSQNIRLLFSRELPVMLLSLYLFRLVELNNGKKIDDGF